MVTVFIYQRRKSNWICLIENPKFSIYSSLYAASTACCCILCQTHCVPLITYLEFRVLARNTSETPRDRWHYEANAGLYACVAVLLWGERSGLVPRLVPWRFPGVSNGRHRISSQPFFNLVETMLLSAMQHVSVTVLLKKILWILFSKNFCCIQYFWMIWNSCFRFSVVSDFSIFRGPVLYLLSNLWTYKLDYWKILYITRE